MDDLLKRAYETLDGWRALGHARERTAQALIVHNVELPRVYEANFAAQVRAETPDEMDAFLASLEVAFAGREHRLVYWDPEMPLACEARLGLEGFAAEADQVVLALHRSLARVGPRVDVRAVESESDWRVVADLQWQNHCEEVTKGLHAAWERSVTEEIVSAKRRKAPGVQYFLATWEGRDCAFFSAWPGENGVGKVEDLFTSPRFRGRGIATALIARCVDDARARGAGPVLIGARTEDTPMHMYADLGFAPLCIDRRFMRRRLDAPSAARPPRTRPGPG